MRVSLIYEVLEVNCDICEYFFVSVIETDMIEWDDDNKEVRYIEEIECPHCGKITEIKRD